MSQAAKKELRVTLNNQQVLAAVTEYLARRGMEVTGMSYVAKGFFAPGTGVNGVNGVTAFIVEKSAASTETLP
jgi:hypothetical protein